MLEPVRASYRTNESIPWTRVHNLADFAYFQHDIHVKKGVTCVECHGDVAKMPLMWREHTLQMDWCLECHRRAIKNPQQFPDVNQKLLSTMKQVPHDSGDTLSDSTHADLSVLISCSTCHR